MEWGVGLGGWEVDVGLVIPVRAGPRPCPVKRCRGRSLTRTVMRVHFWYRHVRDTTVILETENLPYYFL